MSLIFDALQRSEADRSRIDLSALQAATDVLQLAERHAVSERKAGSQGDQPYTVRNSGQETSVSIKEGRPAVAVAETPGLADVSSVEDENLDVFDRFQPLPVTVSPAKRLVSLTDSESLAAEKFRFLGISLQHLQRERSLKKVLITSSIPQEGKTLVSANLACTLARRTQQRVLLIEGDVRRPTLSAIFGLGMVPGICECLQGERDLAASVYHLKELGLWFLPAGSAPKNPLELLQSGKLSAMIDQLTGWFDWIMIDSPPVMPLADTSVWMRLAEGILLVVRQGVSEKQQLQRGLDALEPKKMIGAILNGSQRSNRNDYYYTRPVSKHTNESTR
jgi:capsular exopolysaccharide synthesis family protein